MFVGGPKRHDNMILNPAPKKEITEEMIRLMIIAVDEEIIRLQIGRNVLADKLTDFSVSSNPDP